LALSAISLVLQAMFPALHSVYNWPHLTVLKSHVITTVKEVMFSLCLFVC